MKIRKSPYSNPPFVKLKSLKVGSTFQLQRPLNRNMEREDPFLVVDLQSYSLYCDGRCDDWNKVAVLNLRHNRLSYICGDRLALPIDVEVHIV